LHKNQVIDFQWYFLRIRLRHKPILVIYAGSTPSVARLWKQQAGIARATERFGPRSALQRLLTVAASL